MAGYSVLIEEDVSAAVLHLSDGDKVFVLVDLALILADDPHGHGDIWMTLGDAVWRVLPIGESSARLVYVVDDKARTVTLSALMLR